MQCVVCGACPQFVSLCICYIYFGAVVIKNALTQCLDKKVFLNSLVMDSQFVLWAMYLLLYNTRKLNCPKDCMCVCALQMKCDFYPGSRQLRVCCSWGAPAGADGYGTRVHHIVSRLGHVTAVSGLQSTHGGGCGPKL